MDGPSSTWALRESQLLEGVNDAHRYAGYLCRIAGAEHKHPIAVLSSGQYFSEEFHRGWPNLTLHNSILSLWGPLPLTCGCNGHSVLQGFDDQGDFVSTQNRVLGTQFWKGSSTSIVGNGDEAFPQGWRGWCSVRSGPYAVSFFVFRLRFLEVLFRLMEDWFSLRFLVVRTSFYFQCTSDIGMACFFELIFVWRCFLEFVFKHSSVFDGYFPYGWYCGCYAAAHWFSDGEVALSTNFKKAPSLFEAEGDGGTGLLTGVRRRVVNARFRQSVPFVCIKDLCGVSLIIRRFVSQSCDWASAGGAAVAMDEVVLEEGTHTTAENDVSALREV